MPDRRPICPILGGANGARKSSIHEALAPVGTFVNADAAAKLIAPGNPETASLAAGRGVLSQLDSLIGARADFVYETTLSSNQSLAVMRRANKAGYEIGLVFVVLATVDLHVERVAQRVARGGHNIPESIVRRRYDKRWPGWPWRCASPAQRSFWIERSIRVPWAMAAIPIESKASRRAFAMEGLVRH